jgi:hypothetical protein
MPEKSQEKNKYEEFTADNTEYKILTVPSEYKYRVKNIDEGKIDSMEASKVHKNL